VERVPGHSSRLTLVAPEGRLSAAAVTVAPVSPNAIDSAGLNQTERQTVQSACALLHLEPSDAREKLSAGRSGALVVRCDSAGQRMVLKVTTDTARLTRARSELDLISEGPTGLADLMPRYIAGHATSDMVCLATEEHQPLPHPRVISDEEWAALASSLGRLHNAPVPGLDLQAATAVDASAVADAARFWARLGCADDAQRAAHLVLRYDGTSDGPAPIRPVPEHGDCHTENVVRDENGGLRWIDWEEARLGEGFSDLVFLWQRAEFAGASPPREAMVDAYSSARNLNNDSRLHEALQVAELRQLFISWPPFLSYGAAENRERLMERLPRLIDSLS